MKAVALWRGRGKSCAKKDQVEELGLPFALLVPGTNTGWS